MEDNVNSTHHYAETSEEVIEIISSEDEEQFEQSNSSVESQHPSLQSQKSDVEPLECHICKEKFRFSSSLKTHLQTHTGIACYKCTLCENTYATPSQLQTHLHRHLKINRHKCFDCEESFESPFELQRHMMKSHGGDCNDDWPLEGRVGMPKHALGYNENAKQVCGVWKEAVAPVVGQKRFKCQYCNAVFAQKNRLRYQDHINMHRGIRPHTCDICSKSFVCNAYLKDHLKHHLGLSDYSCTMCESSFKSPSELELHGCSHLGVRPHKCSYCERSFVARSELKTHLLLRHKDDKNDGGRPQNGLINGSHREQDACTAAETEAQENITEKTLSYSGNSSCDGVLVKDEVIISQAYGGTTDLVPNLCFEEALQPRILLKQATGFEEHIIDLKKATDVSIKAHNQTLGTNSTDPIQKTQIRAKNGILPIPMENQRDLLGGNVNWSKDYEEKPATHAAFLIQTGSDLEILRDEELEKMSSEEYQHPNECVASELTNGSSPSLLEAHRTKAHDCHICQKSFSSSSRLKVHLKRHNLFKCTLCKLSFARASQFEDHQNLHLGTKPHRCCSCNQAFANRFELEQHMSDHRDEDSFSVLVAVAIEAQEDILKDAVCYSENVLQGSGMNVELIKEEQDDWESADDELFPSNQSRTNDMPDLTKVQVKPEITCTDDSQIDAVSRDSYNEDSSSYTNTTSFTEPPNSPALSNTTHTGKIKLPRRGRPSKIHSDCPSLEELQGLTASERRKVENRAKNNEASRLSRLRKKQRDDEDLYLAELVHHRNSVLNQEMEDLTRVELKLYKELSKLH